MASWTDQKVRPFRADSEAGCADPALVLRRTIDCLTAGTRTYRVTVGATVGRMDPKAMLWNARAPARQPRSGERVWSLRKDGRQVDAELRGHGEYGWECQ